MFFQNHLISGITRYVHYCSQSKTVAADASIPASRSVSDKRIEGSQAVGAKRAKGCPPRRQGGRAVFCGKKGCRTSALIRPGEASTEEQTSTSHLMHSSNLGKLTSISSIILPSVAGRHEKRGKEHTRRARVVCLPTIGQKARGGQGSLEIILYLVAQGRSVGMAEIRRASLRRLGPGDDPSRGSHGTVYLLTFVLRHGQQARARAPRSRAQLSS